VRLGAAAIDTATLFPGISARGAMTRPVACRGPTCARDAWLSGAAPFEHLRHDSGDRREPASHAFHKRASIARMSASDPDRADPALGLKALLGDRRFRVHLVLFCLVNAALYAWMALGHSLVRFHGVNYRANSYHYLPDPRIIDPRSFHLLSALNQYDAQWFTRIADEGYKEYRPGPGAAKDEPPHRLSFAFPPLYPMLIGAATMVVGSVELGAFIVAQVLLLAGFASIYWLVSRWYTGALAARTAWLLFLHPFSIFYRSYFSEGLFLVLLVITLDAMRLERFVRAGVSIGLLAVTRLVGGVSGLALVLQALPAWLAGRLGAKKALRAAVAALLPIGLYALLCYAKTGNPLFFVKVRAEWFWGYPPPLATLRTMSYFATIPWHGFHYSRIDVLSIVLSGVLLLYARRWLPRYWWYFSLFLWVIPILTTDTMSASRYQVVNLPLFLYAADKLPTRWYVGVAVLSAGALLVVSLYFVNWYWIG
jgi:hypothetical protein